MTPERQQERKILDIKVKKEVEFPTDPEKRFEAVFSAIGNSEAKCLTLLCLTQSPITSHDLHRKFVEASNGVWRIHKTTPKSYCLATLIPIGLVVEADILYYGVSEYVTGFRVSEAGLKYGQPIAAFLLEKSSKIPYSLLSVFGTTQTRGATRSPINRAKILEYLYQKQDIQRTIDIANQLGFDDPEVVAANLKHLSGLNLVEYSSINPEEAGYAKYTLSKKALRGKVKQVGTQPRLTQDVANLLFELRTVDAVSLAEKLKDYYPKSSYLPLKINISRVLAALEKQGICHPDLFCWNIHSQAKITKNGLRVVTEIISPIKEALENGEGLLTSWRRIPWYKYAPEAILKHKETSSYVSKRPQKEWVDDALSLIFKNPGIRPKEIKDVLKHNPTTPLRTLLEQGKIRKEKQGMAVRYYPIQLN